MFLVRSGFGVAKIYRSNNFGQSWTDVTGNLPDVPHNDLFIDPGYTSHYYTANDLGVYRSTNSGETWERQGNGMPFVPAMDFSYARYGAKRLLRVGTHQNYNRYRVRDLFPAVPLSILD
jgi:photosystem II stability/assembly factor-like uncharacterized protein